MPLAAGTRLGPYVVEAPIGAGGMGEVYRARDLNLDRRVALKILPEAVSQDRERLGRFRQEARAASALNHPHIVSIHETGEAESVHYIAMELVDGVPFDEWAHGQSRELRRIVRVVIQVADALSTAHDAAIVHRDVKPANILVTAQGYAKVLDFGLAKLVESARAADVTHTSPALSRAGTVMGTAAYMSPEQALGKPLDARTDIFSLGVVFYEAVAGRRPFDGDTDLDLLHAVVRTAPHPLRAIDPRAPAELEWILDKALAKDLDERYHTMREFGADLRRLLRRLEVGETAAHDIARRDLQPSAFTRLMPLAATAVLAFAAGAGAMLMRGRAAAPAAPSDSSAYRGTTLRQLTNDPGYEGEATFSSDGRTIAYVSDRNGNYDIYLKQVSGGPDINLTNHTADDVQPEFSPDGSQIAFVSSRAGTTDVIYQAPNVPLLGGDIWIMPALGGSPRRIAAGGNFPSWSPDGGAILYSAGPWFGQKLYRVASSGGEPREIPIQFSALERRPGHLAYPRYSPDGQWIAFAVPGEYIYVLSRDGGQPRPLVQGDTPVWSPDGRAIIYANPQRNFSLWRLPFDGREGVAAADAQPLTIDRGRNLRPTISRDGRHIAFSAVDVSSNVERVAFDAEAGRQTGQPEALTRGQDALYFFSASPDGSAVVYEARGGTWRANVGAATAFALLSDPDSRDGWPRWSPDGRSIAFVRTSLRTPGALPGLWLMEPDGANPRPLLEGAGLTGLFAWTPDGASILSIAASDRQLYATILATKATRRLTTEPGVMPIISVSRDGQWAVYQSVQSGNVDVHAVPIGGGPSRVVAATPRQDYHPFLSPSGRWLYFQLDHKELHRVPGPAQEWRSAPPQKITDFRLPAGAFIEDPQISADGRYLLYARGRIVSDVWVLEPAGARP